MKTTIPRIGLLFVLAFTFLFAGCGVTKSDIEIEVKGMVAEQFSKDEDMKGLDLKVEKVVLIQRTKVDYTGIVTVLKSGKEHQINITVTCDGDNVLFEIKPEAIAPLLGGDEN